MGSVLHSNNPRDWIMAVHRMRAEGITGGMDYHEPDFVVYSVQSGTVPGLLYTVKAWKDNDGKQHYECDCDAGEHGHLCKHIAWVAIALKWLDVNNVQNEQLRIKREKDTERAAALAERSTKRKAAKVVAKRSSFLDRVNAKGLTRGQRVQLRRDMIVLDDTTIRPDPLDDTPIKTHTVPKGAWGVIEGINHADETLRVTLPATNDTLWLDPSVLKIAERPAPSDLGKTAGDIFRTPYMDRKRAEAAV